MVDIEMASWGRISEQGWRKGPWTPEEDKLLMEYVRQNGEGRWSCVSKCAGLNRSGKSCRLRWVNYLRPGLKKGHITPQEEGIIIELHALWGNKWSTIARYLPGRTDNEIKNYWRTHFKKRSKPSNDDNKHDKTAILLRQLQAEQNEKIIQHEEEDKEKGSGETTTQTGYNAVSAENGHHQLPLMQPMMDQDHHGGGVGLSENYNFVPVDMSYSSLWSGLWNVDDHHHQSGDNCSKMAIQNQASVGNCAGRGGDNAMNYMQSGGYIF